MKSLREQLVHIIDLQLPGFERMIPPGTIYQLGFDNRSASVWFAQFVKRVKESIGKKYFPIYRMADGEFIFCCGQKPGVIAESSNFAQATWIKLKGMGMKLMKSNRMVKTIWGEYYSSEERTTLMPRFKDCLKEVAEEGALALHFTRSPGRFSEQYIEPMCEWFKANEIPITPDNYVPFYFVYAFLCGPERYRLFSGRTVLVVTSASIEKRKLIEKGLKQTGVQEVQFVSVSPNKSLMDRIDLSHISLPIDVALIAAGIGSVNILCQLRPLNTVCIDAGICVDALADPSLKKRIFMVPDTEI